MRERNRLTRRGLIAAFGGAAAAGLAGCLGGDSSTDEGSRGSGGSDGGSSDDENENDSDGGGVEDDPEITGQLDTEETVSDTTEWEYDLEPGDTLTATFDGDEYAAGRIYRGDSTVIADSDIVTSGEDLAIAQVTAEETQMYRVAISPESSVDVKIYLDSA